MPSELVRPKYEPPTVWRDSSLAPLKAAGLRLGLLVNIRSDPKAEIERMMI
jgi:hypothetical protein